MGAAPCLEVAPCPICKLRLKASGNEGIVVQVFLATENMYFFLSLSGTLRLAGNVNGP